MAAAWFVRQGEKVFGPFDSAKLKQLADAKKIGPQTEISQSNAGPWLPASRVKGLFPNVTQAGGERTPSRQAAATAQQCALPPPLDPPAVTAGVSIADYSVIVGIIGIVLGLAGFACAWMSSTSWLAMPTSIVGFLVGGLACALVWMQRSQGVSSDRPPIVEIAGAAVSLLAMIAVLMLPSGAAIKEVASRGGSAMPAVVVQPGDAPEAKSEATGPAGEVAPADASDSKGESAEPQKATAKARVFPPIGNRYDTISDDAKSIVKALKKIDARTEIGVNFLDYDKTVSETFPEVKIFLESVEARDQPELRFFLGNAMDCYLKVRELWRQSISEDSPTKKYEASMAMITARPMLWKVAGANIAGAAALIESPKSDLQKVQDSTETSVETLTLVGALKAAADQEVALWRETRAKKTGCPVPPEVPQENRQDLAAIAFEEGDYPNGLSAGGFESRLPPIYESVPPASQEGELRLQKDGEMVGRLDVLIYSEVETARKAYSAMAISSLGSERQPLSDLGNIAQFAKTERINHTNVVFRRHTAVVSGAFFTKDMPIEVISEGLRRLDARISKIVGEGEHEAVPQQATEVAPKPAVESSPPQPDRPAAVASRPTPSQEPDKKTNLSSKLAQDGDFGKEITVGMVTTEIPPFLFSIGGSGEKASAPLLKDGEQKGVVAGFVYGDVASAAQAVAKVIEGMGRECQKIGRVGNEAAAVLMPSAGNGDLVFRRDETVVCIRCPVKTTDQLVVFAKKIDARLSGADAKKEDVTMPDVFDIRALSESAEEMVKEGGDKATFAKIIVSIAASKKWVRKGEEEDEPFEGTVVEVTPDGTAVFETAKGRITLRAQELSGDSGARIVRLKDVCKKLAAIQE